MSQNIQRDLRRLGLILSGQALKAVIVGAVQGERKLDGLLRGRGPGVTQRRHLRCGGRFGGRKRRSAVLATQMLFGQLLTK